AGIDGALRVVKRLRGEAGAKWTAEEWMEYRMAKSVGVKSGSKADSKGKE
ncbi:MAG: hypothetical protein H8E37_12100, partial [Planctomycetes bacterium]|nr:hypothetical protein [Planctomycetota bacterium]